MTKVYSAFRLTPEVFQAIEERSLQTGTDKTAVVEQALRQAFGFPEERSEELLNNNVLQRLTDLETLLNKNVLQRLTDLEARSLNCDSRVERSPRSPSVQGQVEPCSARALARRLGFKSHGPVVDRKHKPDFPDWSVMRDPEGIAWEYRDDSGLFHPQAR